MAESYLRAPPTGLPGVGAWAWFAVPRRFADAQLPRMLQGSAPALAMNQIGQFGIRGGTGGDSVGASFEAQ
jgi:hypothetical protein